MSHEIAVSIKTFDRSPAENYLRRTLSSLGDSGFWESERLHSFRIIDSGSPDLESFIVDQTPKNAPKQFLDVVVDTDPGRTLHQTAAEAIRQAADTNAKYALVLEDDIEVCAGFLDSVYAWLETHSAPSTYPMYCFGAPYHHVANALRRGRTLWPYPVRAFYGAQALAWRIEEARDLADWLGDDPFFTDPETGESIRDRHHDLLLRQWAEERGNPFFAASVPPFVQHIGTKSTLGNKHFTFHGWQGAEWTGQDREPRRSLLWVGDAAVSSGFARCTHAVCDELHAAGWDVNVLGLNYFGNPNPYPYSIYPCRDPLDGGTDRFGVGRLPLLAGRLCPDVLVILNDCWNVQEYLTHSSQRGIEFPVSVGWIAVDAENQVGHELNGLTEVVTWTEFAKEELAKGGCERPTSIVPLGVDHSLFRPLDKAEARAKACPDGMPDDAFIVGVVSRNQPRKRLDLSLAYFAEWIERYDIDDAFLHMHIAETDGSGYDLTKLTRYYGLGGKVILSQPFNSAAGARDEEVPWFYNAFDCLLITSQGEGWCLPALEAMACGVPVIAPDWSGLGDWARGAASLATCPTTAVNAPLSSLAYTIGGIPGKDETVNALHEVYAYPWRKDLRSRGLDLASRYSWERTGREFREILERIIRE